MTTFQSKGSYDRTVTGIAVYPDLGGFFTGLLKRNLEK